MKRFSPTRFLPALPLAVGLLFLAFRADAGQGALANPRALLLSTASVQAAAAYAPLCADSSDADRAAEYAYALAVAGLPEPALYQMDRALILEPLNENVRFCLAEVLSAFGLDDAAAEQHAAVPGWLGSRPPAIPALSLPLPPGNPDNQFSYVSLLMAQKRYAQAAVLFSALLKADTQSARLWAGYAVSLEKLGAYQSAAAAVAEDARLSPEGAHKTNALVYQEELLKTPPQQYGYKANQALKGRYLVYFGGGANKSGGNDSIYSLSTRVGKFLSDRFDASFNAGFTSGYANHDYNGLTTGLSVRYNVPLPLGIPLNGTLATKLNRVPAPKDNFTWLLSPGCSYFMDSGSVDLFWDLGLAGAYSGSSTFSIGYTVYFGGGSK